jgi:hypothetical protein
VLWIEEMCVHTTVVLSEADRIINAAAVRNYLAFANKTCVEVVWLPGLHHGEFLFKYVISIASFSGLLLTFCVLRQS